MIAKLENVKIKLKNIKASLKNMKPHKFFFKVKKLGHLQLHLPKSHNSQINNKIEH